MSALVHPTAVIDEGATLGEGVDVDAAVLAAWPVAVRLGLVAGEVLS